MERDIHSILCLMQVVLEEKYIIYFLSLSLSILTPTHFKWMIYIWTAYWLLGLMPWICWRRLVILTTYDHLECFFLVAMDNMSLLKASSSFLNIKYVAILRLLWLAVSAMSMACIFISCIEWETATFIFLIHLNKNWES